jgi:hypothetical protein
MQQRYAAQQAAYAEEQAAQAEQQHEAPPAPAPAPVAPRAPVVINVRTSANAQANLNRIPRPAPVQSQGAALPARLPGKPFQGAQFEPAVSPYLNMYRRDVDSNNLPNYFAFVRPQLDQQEAHRQQTAEMQKLRAQIQSLSTGGGVPNSANMSSHARYMDTGQFYRGLRR